MKIEELACPNCGAALKENFSPGQQIECGSCGSVFIASELEAPTSIACPGCRTINPIAERYCAKCGNPLKIDCVLCQTENLIGMVYCSNCGANLEQARSRRQKMQDEWQKIHQERARLFKEKEVRQQAEKLQQLIEALDEPENHDFAIYQINQLGATAIDALLETLAHDDDVDARYGSARALGNICSDHNVKGLNKARVVKTLISALADAEPAVRYWAANALGKCKAPTAIEPLAPLLKDKHTGVRQQAARAIERIGGERAAEILAQHEKKGLFNWIKGT